MEFEIASSYIIDSKSNLVDGSQRNDCAAVLSGALKPGADVTVELSLLGHFQ